MILVDFSSTCHRMISASSNDVKPIDGKKPTEDFIYFALYLIIQEIYNVQKEHSNKFGDIVLCLDSSKNGYWRSDVYKNYKNSRKKGREESELNWKEIYSHINDLVQMITEYLPWKVIAYPRAEADDIILVLARTKNVFEKIMIHSPDKDMIQAQRFTNNVFQYSALTKKWLKPENKHDNMEHWLAEHVCLGDVADEVPRVVDFTEFSENFIHFLKENHIDTYYHEVHNFKLWGDKETKINLLTTFDKHKVNKKGEILEKDIYKDIRFGPSSLADIHDGTWELKQRKAVLEKKKAELKEQGLKITEINKEIKSLLIKDETPEKRFNDWLDSHPLYREHYERNFTLVMEEGIPTDIWNGIILEYNNAKNDFCQKEYFDFLRKNNLEKLKLTTTFATKVKGPLTAADFDW